MARNNARKDPWPVVERERRMGHRYPHSLLPVGVHEPDLRGHLDAQVRAGLRGDDLRGQHRARGVLRGIGDWELHVPAG